MSVVGVGESAVDHSLRRAVFVVNLQDVARLSERQRQLNVHQLVCVLTEVQVGEEQVKEVQGVGLVALAISEWVVNQSIVSSGVSGGNGVVREHGCEELVELGSSRGVKVGRVASSQEWSLLQQFVQVEVVDIGVGTSGFIISENVDKHISIAVKNKVSRPAVTTIGLSKVKYGVRTPELMK